MNEVSFSYYQIIIVLFFLLSLFAAHYYVRKNKALLSGKFGKAKYLQVLEDLSVGPSEKIRLIKVGSEFILLASARGSSPSIQVLNGLIEKKRKLTNSKQLKESPPSTNDKDRKPEALKQSNIAGNISSKGYGSALKTAIQQARKMNPHVSF